MDGQSILIACESLTHRMCCDFAFLQNPKLILTEVDWKSRLVRFLEYFDGAEWITQLEKLIQSWDAMALKNSSPRTSLKNRTGTSTRN